MAGAISNFHSTRWKARHGCEAVKPEIGADMRQMLNAAGNASDFLKTMTHPSRLMILCALVEGEHSVRDLEDTLGIRQPGLSQQLAQLREAKLVATRKESKSVYYSLADERVRAFVGLLYEHFCPRPERAGIRRTNVQTSARD